MKMKWLRDKKMGFVTLYVIDINSFNPLFKLYLNATIL